MENGLFTYQGTQTLSQTTNLDTTVTAISKRKLFSPNTMQLNLNCVRQEDRRREPLLRPLDEASEDNYLQMISARTPLIEADSDRESCV